MASRSDATAATHLTSLSHSLGGERVWQVKEPKALGKRVGIDWHWTLQCQDSTGVDILPSKNLAALQKLQAAGFFCALVSYCFRNRELEVRKQLDFLARDRGIQFDQVIFVRNPLGPQGKAAACQKLRLNALFEDREDICAEALTKGIDVFPIISPKSKHHNAAKKV